MIGTASLVAISAGILSTAMPTSQGPARAARLAATIMSVIQVTFLRCGRSRLPSSARLRRRSSSETPLGSSSISSAAMPRQDCGCVAGWGCLVIAWLRSRAVTAPVSASVLIRCW